jgi:hypothetical protein
VSSPSPYSELDETTWLELLVRGAIWRACAPRLWELGQPAEDRPAVGAALADVHRCAARAARWAKKSGQSGVKLAMAGWSESIAVAIDDESISEEDRRLLAEILQLVEEVECGDPFGELFTRLASQTRHVYRDSWQGADFEVVALPQPLQRAPNDPFGVTATTYAADADLVVELWIRPNMLGPAAYGVIPYLLVHELVCHVGARQEEVDNGSQFAEGLMDWVAEYFFRRWIGEVDHRLAAAAEGYFEQLASLQRVPTSEGGAVRIYGHQAGRQLVAWLVGVHGRSRAQAEAETARLGVEINCEEASLARKDLLVTRMNEVHRTPDFAKNLLAVIERRQPPSVLL